MPVISAQRDAIESLLRHAGNDVNLFLNPHMSFHLGDRYLFVLGVSVSRSTQSMQFPQNVLVLGIEPSWQSLSGHEKLVQQEQCQAVVLLRYTTKAERKQTNGLQEAVILLHPVKDLGNIIILEPTDTKAFYTRV